MSSQKTIGVQIVAKDQASKQFLDLAKTMRTAAAQMEQIGTSGSAAMTRVEKSTRAASSSLDEFEKRAVSAGAAIGTTVGVLSKLGAAAETQRRQVAGIGAAYGDASAQILRFTDSIQQSTRFSNEDARQAAQIAATLAQNYGFTAAEVEKLIRVSADLAAVHGMSLADATQRTVAAMRGEAESAEALGLTLNQQAIDRDNLTQSMSQEEAAHFRLNALLDQAAYAHGQAGAQAATAAGQTQQYVNQLQDLAVNAGQALGPVTGVASVLGDVALIAPAAGAGVGKLVGMLGTGGLLGVIGPVGLAAGAAAVGIGLLTKHILDERAAAEGAISPTNELADAIQALGESSFAASGAQDIADDWVIAANTMKDAAGGISQTLNDLEIARRDQHTPEAQAEVQRLEEQLALQEKLAATAEERAKIDANLARIVASGNLDAIHAADALIERFNAGIIGADQLAGALGTLAGSAASFGSAAGGAAQATAALGDAAGPSSQKLRDLAAAADHGATRLTAMADAWLRVREAGMASGAGFGAGFGVHDFGNQQKAIEDYGRELDEIQRKEDEAARAADQHRSEVQSAYNEMRSAAEAIVQSQEQEADRAQQIADIQSRAAEEQADAYRSLQQARRNAERGYQQEVRAAAKARVEIERDAAAQIAELDQRRVDVAKDVQAELAGLAKERASVEQQTMQALADAQRDYQQTQQDSVGQQRELRAALRESIEQETLQWREAVRDNKQQLEEIERDLRQTLGDLDREFARSLSDLTLDRQRAFEDISRLLADPNISNEQKNEAIIDYNRLLEDSAETERRLRDDTAREEERARKDAAQRSRELNQAKKEAAQDYHDTVKSLEADTAEQVKDLQRQAADAAASYSAKVKGIRDEEAGQLKALAADEQRIREDAGKQYAEIEAEKRRVANETATQLRTLDRDTAQAAKDRQKDLTAANRDYNQAIRDSANEATEAISGVQDVLTPLERALQEGYLTKNQFDRIMERAPEVTDFFDKVDAFEAAQAGKAILDVDLVPADVRNDPAWDQIINKRGPFGAEGATITVKSQKDAGYQGTIDSVDRDLESITGKTHVATIDLARGAKWGETLSGVQADIANLSKSVTIDILGNTSYGSGGAGGKVGAAAAGNPEPWQAKYDGVILQRDALDGTSATIDIKADSSEFNRVVAALKEQYAGKVFATSYIQLKVRNPDGSVVEGPKKVPAETPPATGGGGPRRAMGGPAEGWFIAGDSPGGNLGPNWEAVYAPEGAYVLPHDESMRLFGMGFGLPTFRRGGRAGGGGKGGKAQGSDQWRKYINALPGVAKQHAKSVFGDLTKEQIKALVHGDLVFLLGDDGGWWIVDQGETSIPGRKFFRGNEQRSGGGGGGGQRPEPEPEPAPAPIDLLPPTPAPLPVTQIAGDLPAFTGISSPFAITASQRAAMEAQRLALAGSGQNGSARVGQSANGDPIGQLTGAVRSLERQVQRLADRLRDMEEIQQNPLAVYGNAYFEAGPSLSAQQDAARASATAYRFG
jgi:hypothetical protein